MADVAPWAASYKFGPIQTFTFWETAVTEAEHIQCESNKHVGRKSLANNQPAGKPWKNPM